MKFTAIRSILAATLCATALQAHAQNSLQKLVSQTETIKVDSAKRAWESSKYFKADRNKSIAEVMKVTSERLKSPNLQKMGGMDGGGGNAILCNENGKMKAELLDLHEAKVNGLEIEMRGNTFEEKLNFTFQRLAKTSYVHAATYRALANNLLTNNANWVTNSELPVINDVDITIIPKDCIRVQVAIQRPISQNNLITAKTYIIDKDVFNLLDEDSKAALILHEVIYRTARYSDVKNSVFVRDLTGLIASNKISDFDDVKYNEALWKNGVYCVEHSFLPTFVGDRGSKCAFEQEANATFYASEIRAPKINYPLFTQFRGLIEKLNQTKEVNRDGGTDNRYLTSFKLKGSIEIPFSQNKNIALSVQNSEVAFGSTENRIKRIAGNASLDIPSLKLKARSDEEKLTQVAWSEICLIDRTKIENAKKFMEQSYPTKGCNRGLFVAVNGRSSDGSRDPRYSSLKVAIPDGHGLHSENGFIEVDGASIDANGNLYEIYNQIDTFNVEIYNFRTKQTYKVER